MFQPVGEMIFSSRLVSAKLDHAATPAFNATSDPKLKHWNHSSLCFETPPDAGALYVFRDYGDITFSSILRFWLISSSAVAH